jgi:chemotaxis protein histidine kinase CheA
MDNKINILKQAKHDIFIALDSIIKSHVMKGAEYSSLKKYYKNNKNFEGLLREIRNKGINFFKTDKEYKLFVKDILSELFDDRISYEKDKKNVTEMKTQLKNFGDFLTEKKKASPAQIAARKKFADMVAGKKKDAEPKVEDETEETKEDTTKEEKPSKDEKKSKTKKNTKPEKKTKTEKTKNIKSFGGFTP